MKIRTLALLLSVVMVLGLLAGCGSRCSTTPCSRQVCAKASTSAAGRAAGDR